MILILTTNGEGIAGHMFIIPIGKLHAVHQYQVGTGVLIGFVYAAAAAEIEVKLSGGFIEEGHCIVDIGTADGGFNIGGIAAAHFRGLGDGEEIQIGFAGFLYGDGVGFGYHFPIVQLHSHSNLFQISRHGIQNKRTRSFR